MAINDEYRDQHGQAAETLALLQEYATRAGYDEQDAVARILYGTFVSRAHRYVYMETPKAACTAMKRMVVALEGVAFEERAWPYSRESRLDMFIHQRRHIALPTLLDLDPAELDSMLAGRSGWFVFALCRNPYSRLVSLFENKVRTGEPNYRHFTARFADPRPHGGIAASFHAFIKSVMADTATVFRDPHFQPQTQLLLPRLIPYTNIFKVEAVDQALAALHAHLAAQGKDRPLVLERINRSPPRNWRGLYDMATAARVAESYAGDFSWFGYDPADYQPSPDAEPPVETEIEHYWREQVVARNALIDFLYDLILERRTDVIALSARDDEIIRLGEEVAAREEEIVRLREEVAACKEEIGRLREESIARKEEIVRLCEETAARVDEINQLDRIVDNLHHSISWRITAPIRWMKRG